MKALTPVGFTVSFQTIEYGRVNEMKAVCLGGDRMQHWGGKRAGGVTEPLHCSLAAVSVNTPISVHVFGYKDKCTCQSEKRSKSVI